MAYQLEDPTQLMCLISMITMLIRKYYPLENLIILLILRSNICDSSFSTRGVFIDQTRFSFCFWVYQVRTNSINFFEVICLSYL